MEHIVNLVEPERAAPLKWLLPSSRRCRVASSHRMSAPAEKRTAEGDKEVVKKAKVAEDQEEDIEEEEDLDEEGEEGEEDEDDLDGVRNSTL